MLVGVGDPQEERVVEAAPDELHADRETGRGLAHGQGKRWVAGVAEGLGVAGPPRFIAMLSMRHHTFTTPTKVGMKGTTGQISLGLR